MSTATPSYGRCLVLLDRGNGQFQIHNITKRWYGGLNLIRKNVARPYLYYDKKLKTSGEDIEIPAVVVLTRYVPYFGMNKRTKPTRKEIFIRDNMSCMYCGQRLGLDEMTLDHVIPKSRGGKDCYSNLVCCCEDCNLVKSDKTPDEAKMVLRRDPRHLTPQDRIEIMMKTHKKKERQAWMDVVEKHGVNLF